MGCDMHDYLEVRRDGIWTYAGDNAFPSNRYEQYSPFDGVRSYRLFGFLADVRNYSQVPPICEPRGLPEDVSPEVGVALDGLLGHSWLTLAELLAVDYGQVVEDRRGDRGCTLPAGEGTREPLGDFLGDEWYFNRLKLMGAFGDPQDVRIVFAFD